MCLKPRDKIKEKLGKQIIEDSKKIINILEESKLKENFFNYELVRTQGKYNMLDDNARQLTGLSEEDYIYIIKHYEELMKKYPDVKAGVLRYIEYIKSANIAKIVAIKGCENCRLIVCEKLDVKENDLCENCRKIIAEHKL